MAPARSLPNEQDSAQLLSEVPSSPLPSSAAILQAPTASLLRNSRDFLRLAWWMPTFPGLAIFVTVLSLNLVGDELNDALNPRLRQRAG
jgi:hypothetical protein